MTKQFKFGDRVRDETLGLGECVVINASDDAVYVMNTRGDYNVVARPEHLELIPHPDTVRLDYLLFNEYAYLIGRYGKRYGIGRDEIDAAMQIQAAETA